MSAEEYVATFATAYRVLAADRCLALAGLPHGLTPTPAGVASPCGLSLRVPAAEGIAAAQAIAAAAIVVDAWYRLDDGRWQPAPPPT